MIEVKKIKKIGYGFGFGGAFATNVKYTNDHKKALYYFCVGSKGNFVDTSITYGNGISEKIIGKLSNKIKKANFISTKVSAANLDYKNFIKSFLQSLKNLKVKKIDLIQPHWPNYDVENKDIVRAFEYLKKKRKVRFFGLSNYDLKDFKFFKKKLKNSFKFIQEEFSIRDKEVEKKILFCEKNKIKIICYSPFGSGEIIYSKKEKNLLDQLSQKYKKSKYSIVLNFLSSKSKNIILIPHTQKISHLKDNLSSLDFKLKYSDIKKLDTCFKSNYINIKLRHVVYFNKKYKKITCLRDALLNKGNLSPSPKKLSIKIKEGYELKPIKLKKIKNRFHIKEGRLRYWAHVLAYGWNKKIKMMIA